MRLQTVLLKLLYFSYIKQGPDGDEEVDSKSPSMSVTYVNFDKTKPINIHKQIGDGLPHTSTKTQKNSSKHNLKTYTPPMALNGKMNSTNKESDISFVEKSKNRRQNKILDNEAKQPDMKPSKKHKKDI